MYSTNFNSSQTANGGLIFKSFQKFLKLTTSHRQSDNIAGVSDILDRLADGSFTKDDYNILMTRRSAILDPNEVTKFKSAIHLYPDNASVDKKNIDFLKENKKPVALIRAIDSLKTMNKSLDDKVNGLHLNVQLEHELCYELIYG